MSYHRIADASERYVGVKATVKAISAELAEEAYIAADADVLVTKQVIDIAKRKRTPLTTVSSMRKLGKACGIEVNAAAVAIKKVTMFLLAGACFPLVRTLLLPIREHLEQWSYKMLI
ncbi:ribosomal L7Ae/L30e/S12e/Gadd45 family protein [Geomicrobium sp. JCM 19055]|uniref:ribosomal L7Ae/L30e/S12e/Gadd45 family protein n=1 Tax=Geomicrobium sp. JCM 19055 TaxID=1460649 RepID=UPI00045ED6B0|nr:ribosomal L7Ae family protein [Geomicrobium sp. JCM 19055]